MATGRVNVGGGSGGSMNVYAQLTEPTKKEGVWIKTGTAKKDIINDLELWFADKWNDSAMKKYADMPIIANGKGVACIGTDVYIIGGFRSNVLLKTLYKYDSINDTWTQLADMPMAFTYITTATVGQYIYVAGNTALLYRYDTINDTWTQLANSPSSTGKHVFVSVGTDIYSFYTSGTNYTPALYKYDTLTEAWTVLTTTNYQNNVHVVSYGTDVYMIGAGSSSSSRGNLTRKYDTITKKFSALADAPIAGGLPVIIGKDIHVLFGAKHYIYSIENDTWTLLSDVAPSEYLYLLAYVGGSIVALEDSATTAKNYRYNLTSKTYENGTVIIYRTKEYYGIYQTELVSLPKEMFTGVNTRTLSGFDDVYMYSNNNLNENLPTYYGDGTKWVQFKGF